MHVAAGMMRTERAEWWRRVMPAVLIGLLAGLVSLIPAPQAALAASQGASSISAGEEHSCAIESGTAYCWGGNGVGELGDGSTANSTVPVPVDTSGVLAGKTLIQITAGGGQACALDSTGAAYCWGYNHYGELGDGSTANSTVPVPVDTSGVLAGKTLIQISAAAHGVCALDSAGTAYCWGDNEFGGLGDGSTANSSIPVPVVAGGVLAGKTLTEISAGGADTCALDTVGNAYCWGRNNSGELGNNTTTSSTVPVAVDTSGVLAGKTLTQIAVGNGDACALDSVGTAYCWGENYFGELGTASTASYSSVPVAVDTAEYWPARLSPRSPPAPITRVHSTPVAPPTAGDPAVSGSSATEKPPSIPAFRWPWIPAAYWPARLSPRSRPAMLTRARWTTLVPPTAGAGTSRANLAMTASHRAMSPC